MTARACQVRGSTVYPILLGVIVLGFVLSCDDPLNPERQIEPSQPRLTEDSEPEEWETLVFTVPGGGYGPTSVPLQRFDYLTAMELTVSGFVTQTYLPTGTQTLIGPQGIWSDGACAKKSTLDYWAGDVHFSCNGDYGTESFTQAVWLHGSGEAIIGIGNQGPCGSLCYSYSGSRTITMRIPRPKLKLAVRDTVIDVVTAPDTFRFVASFSPTQVSGPTGSLAIPYQVLAWRWKPVGDSVSKNVTSLCQQPRSDLTCKLTIGRSGTVYVDMRINGAEQTAEVPVEVVQGELTLRANRRAVEPGDTITFSPGARPADFAFSVTGWEWAPQGGVRQSITCSTPCVTPIQVSGTMFVIGTISGRADTAFVYVQSLPCPTPPQLPYDSLLNDQNYRDSLRAVLGASNPNATSDTGKIEVPFYVIREKDTGLTLFIRTNDTTATNCATGIPLGVHDLQWEYIVVGHTHPYTPGDPIVVCPGRNIPPGSVILAGPSMPDWRDLDYNDNRFRPIRQNTPVRMHIIDKKNVYLGLPGGLGSADQPYEYPHSDPACPWW